LARMSSITQFNGSTETKSKHTFVPCEYILSLCICLFTGSIYLRVCLHAFLLYFFAFTCLPPLLVCFYMLTSFARLLCICLSTLSSCLLIACDGWSTHATYKGKAKGHILADLGA